MINYNFLRSQLKILFIISSLYFVVWGLTSNVYAAEGKTFIWHFDAGNGDTVQEATGNGNNGKFNDPGIQWINGKINGGLAFAGSNSHPHWIDVPHSPIMDIQDAITLEAWVFPQEISPGRPTIIHKSSSYYFRLDITSQISVLLYGLEPSDYQLSHGKVKLNEWNHIAVTYDGKEIKFYIDGEQDENVVRAAGKIQSNTKPIHFGGDWSG
jgi:hypothetical protein